MLAQELKEVIPEAVIETNDVVLANGNEIKGFLHVDKNRVYMECVGAVIELEKKTETLDIRIDKLEKAIVVSDEVTTIDDSSIITTCSQTNETFKPIKIIKSKDEKKDKKKRTKNLNSSVEMINKYSYKDYYKTRNLKEQRSCDSSLFSFEFKKKLSFLFVENLDEVLALAFDRKAQKQKAKDKSLKKPKAPAAAA